MKMKRNYFGKISVLLSIALIALCAAGITLFASAAETNTQAQTAEPITSIGSAEDLQTFVDSVNTGGLTYEGQEIVLQSDIVFEGEWEAIEQFDGTFKGEGHTISGLTDTFITNLGEPGRVENLNIRSEILYSIGNIGGIADINHGIISGCTFGGIINSHEGKSENGCGGITGVNDGRIENCSTTSNTIILRKGVFVGGIAGVFTGEPTKLPFTKGIYNCVNNATIKTDEAILVNYAGATGGICGYLICPENAQQLKNLSVSIKDCINNGNLTSSAACTGGIVGISENGKITDCQNNGNITQTESLWTGGIVGSFNQTKAHSSDATDIIYIKKCRNSGNITGITRVGGIVGGDETMGKTSYMTIEDCINSGNITTNGYGGGISGYNASKIKRCYNTGDVYANLIGQELDAVDGWNGVGGITAVSSNEISYCFNIGEVKIDVDEPLQYIGISGGLVGRQDGAGKLVCCYNSGPVTGNHDSSTTEEHTVYYGGIIGKGSISTIENCTFNKTSAGKAKRSVASYIGEDSDYGLEASQMTGEAAKENMPYLFEDGMFEIMEDVTIDSVNYSFTPVLAGMENPYSIDSDKMIATASFPYIKIIYHQKTITPQGEEFEGERHLTNVALGEDFCFWFDFSEYEEYEYKYKYDIEITVIVDGEVITPNDEGRYCLANLSTNTVINATFKFSEKTPTPNTPTPNDPAQNENANGNSNATNNTIEQAENVKTGDVAIMGIILLALISVVVIIIFIIKKKK